MTDIVHNNEVNKDKKYFTTTHEWIESIKAAERERCAQLVLKMPGKYSPAQIAAAIRGMKD